MWSGEFYCVLLVLTLAFPAKAAMKWVDFYVPYESLQYAMEQDITTFGQERYISWIDISALGDFRPMK